MGTHPIFESDFDCLTDMSSGVKRDRSRSPNNRGGGFRKERYKVLLKNLPYDVNWQKLKDICKEVGGEGVMFADIIQNQNGKSAGFGSVEFKTKEEMEEIAKKLDGHEVSGRALKCCPDINAEQLVRMCNKQGLDPGRSGMAAMQNRMGGPPGRGGPPHGRYGGDGYGPPGGRYGGGPGGDRGGYGGPPPRGGGGYNDEVPMLNGQPITSLPGMERLHPEVLEAIGKGPVGRTVFVRNLAYTVDEQKCREVFGMAGTIQSVDLVSDRETGKTKGFGTITFAQPIEAVKAIVMFHTQSLFDRKMFLKMDRNNQNRGKEKLPDGLSGINRMDEGNNGGGYSRGPPGGGGYQGGGYNDRGPGSGGPPGGYGGGDRRYGGGPSGGDRGPGGGYGGGQGGGRDSYDSYGNSGGGGYGGGQRDSYAPPSSNGGYNNSGYGGGAGYGSRPSGCVISIENLPMSATTPRLRRLFEDAGRVSFVDLQDHGRAKIRFESHYDAEQAVARFHNYMIEGHGLQVRLADE